MFYSQEILTRRGGKFGLVWLAATRPGMLSRRDYCNVSVRHSCEDIMDFILVRVIPQGHGPRPRFSLYLSSQLMFGVVLIYRKQHDYLLNEVSMILQRLQAMSTIFQDIDLAPIRPDHVTFPDPLEREEVDPLFGMWNTVEVDVPLPAMEMWRLDDTVTSGPGASDESSRTMASPQAQVLEALGSPHTVVSLDQIQIKDPVVHPITMPEEVDIPALDGQELQQLLQPPETEPVLDLHEPVPQTSLAEGEMDIAASTDQAALLGPMEKTPGQRGTSPSMEPRLRRALRRPPSPGITPGAAEEGGEPVSKQRRRLRISLQLDLPPLERGTAATTRKRRTRKLIVDKHIQIPKKVMRHAMVTHADTCREFELPFVKRNETSDFFNWPASREMRMNPKFLALWKRNTLTRAQDDADCEVDKVWCLPDELTNGTTARRGLWADAEAGEERGAQQMQGLEPLPDAEFLHHPEMVVEAASIETRRRDERSVSAERSHILSMEREREPDVSGGWEGAANRSHLSVASISDRSMSSGRSSFTPARLDASPHPSGRAGSGDKSASLTGEVSLISLGGLDVLLEEPEVLCPELPALAAPLPPTTAPLVRQVEELTATIPWTLFRMLCPITTPRPQAARMFMLLLESVAAGRLQVRQQEPYGAIYVRKA